MSHIPKHPSGTGCIFHLTTNHHTIDGKNIPFPGGIILTPEPIADETMVAAWTYALRFSAKGLDLPDYEAALELLIKRHPSWGSRIRFEPFPLQDDANFLQNISFPQRELLARFTTNST